MAEDWRLVQATAVLHAGVSALRGEDDDLSIDIAALLPDETADVQAALLGVARAAKQADALADMAAEHIRALQERKRRFENRSERLRGLVLAALDALAVRKIEAADLTVSVTAGKPAVRIADESAVPDEYWRVEKRLARGKIAADLREGVIITGCEMSNSMPTVVLRAR